MDALTIKTHDFEDAKLAIKKFSEQTTTDLDLKRVNDKKGVGEWLGDAIFGGGIGIYSGYEAGIFTLSLNLASFEYRPTKNIGISTSLVNLNYNLVDRTNSVNFNVLYSPSVGFHYYF